MNLAQITTLLRPGEGRRVLLVEDDRRAAARIHLWLLSLGCDVDWRLGVSIVGDALIGHPPDDAGDSEIHPLDYHFFILDHYFAGTLNGTELARTLSHSAPVAPILAISSVDEANRSMVAQGATAAVRKAKLLSLLPL